MINQLPPSSTKPGPSPTIARIVCRRWFFAARIRHPNTRRAYGRAVADFVAWCEDNQVASLAAVQPLHVAAWIELQTKEHVAPTAKLRLAALRHLFDWLVMGQVVPVNPASSSGFATGR